MAGSKEKKIKRWFWPVGLMATAMAGAGVVLFRGCWHRKMSWPIRSAGYCYQVCTGCGIKRLFDEDSFRASGPFNYDLNKLIALKRSPQNMPEELPAPEIHRSAS